MYVCVHVCMCVYMCVCVCTMYSVHLHMCMCVYMCVCLIACAYYNIIPTSLDIRVNGSKLCTTGLLSRAIRLECWAVPSMQLKMQRTWGASFLGSQLTRLAADSSSSFEDDGGRGDYGRDLC